MAEAESARLSPCGLGLIFVCARGEIGRRAGSGIRWALPACNGRPCGFDSLRAHVLFPEPLESRHPHVCGYRETEAFVQRETAEVRSVLPPLAQR